MGVDWDSWNRLKASSVEIILGEKGKILGSFVTKLKITSLPCRWARNLSSLRLLWALTLFWLLPCCLAFAKQMCWSLKKTDIMSATMPGFLSYPSRNSMIHKTLMLFAHAEAEAWSPVARGDMQRDVNGFLPHFSLCWDMISLPTTAISLWSPAFASRKWRSGENLFSVQINAWKAIIRKKSQENCSGTGIPGICQPKCSTACSIFCGSFGKQPTENWDLKLRWDFRFMSIKSEWTRGLLPPKQFWYNQTFPEIC